MLIYFAAVSFPRNQSFSNSPLSRVLFQLFSRISTVLKTIYRVSEKKSYANFRRRRVSTKLIHEAAQTQLRRGSSGNSYFRHPRQALSANLLTFLLWE